MTLRISRDYICVWAVFIAMICANVAWATQDSRLLGTDVAKMADDKVRETGYSPEIYLHGLPMYVQTSGAWEVHYYHKPKQGGGASAAFTVDVDDATGFASLNFGYPSHAISPPAVAPSSLGIRGIIEAIAVGLLIGGSLRLVSWLQGKRSNAKA